MRRTWWMIGLGIGAAAAVPAGAQGWSNYNTVPGGPGVHREVDRVDREITSARKVGQLSRRHARQLRRENRQIGVLADRYGEGGLSEAEKAELRTRTGVMRAAVSEARVPTPPAR